MPLRRQQADPRRARHSEITAVAASKPRVEIHPLGIGNRSDPVRLVFDAAPGAGVTLGLSDLGDRLRFVSNEVEVVAVPHPMPKLPVARAVWRPMPDFATHPVLAHFWASSAPKLSPGTKLSLPTLEDLLTEDHRDQAALHRALGNDF